MCLRYLKPDAVIDCCTALMIGNWAKLTNAPISSTSENIKPCDWFGNDKNIPIEW